MRSIRAQCAGSWKTGSSSTAGWCALDRKAIARKTMRSCLFLLISFVALHACPAAAAPPADVEIAYELTRNGSPLADIVRRLQHASGSYQIMENWKGRGLFALRGNIKLSS